MKNFFFKKLKKYILLKEVFSICNNSKTINPDKKILGVNNLLDARDSEITFFNNFNYEKQAQKCRAYACIVSKKNQKYLNKSIIPIISSNPLIDFYKVVGLFYPSSYLDNEDVNPHTSKSIFKKGNISVGINCLIDKTAVVGENTNIGNNVIIKSNVHIGRNCKIGSNVVIENSLLGDNIIIKSGTLIGQTGFGFSFENNQRIKFPHIGRVIIENNVQIGSFCTIDRGSLSDTVIGEFSSVDNQVQIAHNVKIGNFCVIAAQSGIAGSTTIGNNVLIGGQSGISGHLIIGNNVKIGGKSGVVDHIKDGQVVMGYPARSIRDFLKN
jgi:UDP-3-O-[3-hydroxymyristoyl] glucosamine N-acyltransferase